MVSPNATGIPMPDGLPRCLIQVDEGGSLLLWEILDLSRQVRRQLSRRIAHASGDKALIQHYSSAAARRLDWECVQNGGTAEPPSLLHALLNAYRPELAIGSLSPDDVATVRDSVTAEAPRLQSLPNQRQRLVMLAAFAIGSVDDHAGFVHAVTGQVAAIEAEFEFLAGVTQKSAPADSTPAQLTDGKSNDWEAVCDAVATTCDQLRLAGPASYLLVRLRELVVRLDEIGPGIERRRLEERIEGIAGAIDELPETQAQVLREISKQLVACWCLSYLAPQSKTDGFNEDFEQFQNSLSGVSSALAARRRELDEVETDYQKATQSTRRVSLMHKPDEELSIGRHRAEQLYGASEQALLDAIGPQGQAFDLDYDYVGAWCALRADLEPEQIEPVASESRGPTGRRDNTEVLEPQFRDGDRDSRLSSASSQRDDVQRPSDRTGQAVEARESASTEGHGQRSEATARSSGGNASVAVSREMSAEDVSASGDLVTTAFLGGAVDDTAVHSEPAALGNDATELEAVDLAEEPLAVADGGPSQAISAPFVPETTRGRAQRISRDRLPTELRDAAKFQDNYWLDANGNCATAPWVAPGFVDKVEAALCGAFEELSFWRMFIFAHVLQRLRPMSAVAPEDIVDLGTVWEDPGSLTGGVTRNRTDRVRELVGLPDGTKQATRRLRLALFLEAVRPSDGTTFARHDVSAAVGRAKFEGGLETIIAMLLEANARGVVSPLSLFRQAWESKERPAKSELAEQLVSSRRALYDTMTELHVTAGGRIQRTHCRKAWATFISRVSTMLRPLYPLERGGNDDLASVPTGQQILHEHQQAADRGEAKFQDRKAMDRSARRIADHAEKIVRLDAEIRRYREHFSDPSSIIPNQRFLDTIKNPKGDELDVLCARTLEFVMRQETTPRDEVLLIDYGSLLHFPDLLCSVDGNELRDILKDPRQQGLPATAIADTRHAAAVLLAAQMEPESLQHEG